MDDDEITRQRAMDAAAAVAVAAAAAAHQHQGAEDLKPEPAGIHALDVGDRKHSEADESYGDGSMQYVASDVNTQNGETSHVDVSPGTASTSRPTVHHTKRRKVNTCLPCKRRKVKCDRDKPYCGQCKKHNFPASECVWSTAIFGPSPAKRRNSEAAGIAAVADAAAAAVSSATATASGSQQWYDMGTAPWSSFTPLPVDQSSQALASRVAELEAASAALASTGDVRQNGNQWDVKGEGAVLSEAERGMAADALAMIAQHDPQASSDLSGSQTISYKGKRLLPFSSGSVPPEVLLYQPASSSRGRDLATLLPDMATIRSLVSDFAILQEHGLDAGVNIKLLNSQLDALEETVKKGMGEIDLSFVALLYYLLAYSLDMRVETEASTKVSLPESVDGDNSPQDTTANDLWGGAGQALLSYLEYRETPNLNTLMALSLKRPFLDARGKRAAAQTALAAALSLCDAELISGTGRQPGATTRQLSYLETQSPLLLEESARMVYCSLVAQHSLQYESSLVHFNFDFDTAKPAERFPRAFFELAKDIEKAKKSSLSLQALAEKWSTPAVLLGKEASEVTSTTEAIVQKYGKVVGYQWTVLQMFAGHQLARLHRKFSLYLTQDSACKVLRHRCWLEEHQPAVFKADKVPVLQQATLEAALLIALRLAEKRAEVLSPEPREMLIKAIGYLSCGRSGHSIAQKLLHNLLAQDDGKEAMHEALQDQGVIFDYVTRICSAGSSGGADEARFWKAIASRGHRLLESSASS